MLKPIKEKLLKSVDELFESNLKIDFDENLENLYSDNKKYQKVVEQNRVQEVPYHIDDLTNYLFNENIAMLQDCKKQKVFQHFGSGKSHNNLYIIPQPVFIYRDDLTIAPLHPYFDKFQYLMDLCFEAGLHRGWELFYDTFSFNYYQDLRAENQDEKEILDFTSIFPFFLMLVFGFLIALFVFLCEIFHRDFLSQLSRKYFIKKIRKILNLKSIK